MPDVRPMTLRIYSALPSSLPSSTSTTSQRRSSPARIGRTRSKNSGSIGRSLNTGTTRDSNGFSNGATGSSNRLFMEHQPLVDDIIQCRDKACGYDLGQHDGECENAMEDRKSTRLNSSHVRISYAVFCLKKKKKNQ